MPPGAVRVMRAPTRPRSRQGPSARGLSLQSGCVLIAGRAMRITELHPRDGSLVGRAHLVPEPYGLRERQCGRGRITLRKPHPPSCVGRTGDEGLALEPGGDVLQLVGGRSSAADVARRDLDLDLRGEEGRSLQVVVRWSLLRRHPHGAIKGIAYGGGRRGRVALGETHQRQTRLGVPSRSMSRQQRFLRAPEVSLVEPNASELGERPPELASQVRSQLVAGEKGLVLRLGTRPAQPEDLRSVDPTAPLDAPDGIGLRPTFHRLGPLLGQVVEREALEGAHQLAVDNPCGEGIQISRHRGHPGLVEQREHLFGRRPPR